MPAAVGERLQQLIGSPYIEGYGLTETIAPTHINPPDRPKRQCLGIPIFNTRLARRSIRRRCRSSPSGQVGEIVTHGPQVFQGYWRNEEATEGRLHRTRRQAVSSAPAIWATSMRTAISSSSTG